MARWLKYTLLILLFLTLAAIPLAMQFETGAIAGTITNEQGAIGNASVEAKNIISGVKFRAETDPDGRYKVEDLRPGRYSMWAKAPGHESVWIPQIVVERGAVARKDIRLRTAPPEVTGS